MEGMTDPVHGPVPHGGGGGAVRSDGRPRGGVPWPAYGYLVYLGMLAFQPLFSGEGPRDGLVAAGLAAAFVPVYLWLYRRRPGDRRGAWALAWFVALGIVAVAPAWNTGGTVFFVYAAAAAPYVLPRRRAVLAIGLLTLLPALLFPFSPVPVPYRWAVFLPALIFVPFVGLLTLAEADRRRADARLRTAHAEVERLATVAERERIARDLHDLLGHTLSTITLKSELAARLATRQPERAEGEMRDVERISREALQEVREAVQGYRVRGLAGELARAKLALEGAGIQFGYDADEIALAAEQEAVAALVLREAVTNVLRHSGAGRCTVTLRDRGDGVELAVRDDGRGGPLHEGNGLAGVRERLRGLGGSLRLEHDGGLALRALLPAPGRPGPPSRAAGRPGDPARGGR